jgi:hypothetical protein
MDEIDNRFLDASILSTNKQNSYIEFKTLLQNMYKCYQLMIDNKIPVPFNDENKIRDILLENYINITQIRHSFCNIKGFRISKEVGVNDGRVDLQIFTLNDIENYKAFYIIECKRLDGGSTLNKAYIKDGVKRFTTNCPRRFIRTPSRFLFGQFASSQSLGKNYITSVREPTLIC